MTNDFAALNDAPAAHDEHAMTETPQRSTFVTVVGWIFTGLSGFATLTAILQTVMFQVIFDHPEIKQGLQKMPPEMPAIYGVMFRHMGVISLAFLLVSAFTLVSSIGLIRRWNWARLCFAGIMMLGVLWNVIGLVTQFFAFSFMQDQMQREFQNMPGGAPDMRAFMIGAMVMNAVFIIGFSVLLGWIAKRLLSAPIAAEFRR
jgi:hypothetical protein